MLAWTWWSGRGGAESDSNELAAGPARVEAPPEAYVDAIGSERTDPSTSERPRDPRYLEKALDPSRFEGRARLEVHLDAPPDFRGAWKLQLEPAKAVVGSEHAVPRTVDVMTGSRSLVLDDVVLGGYVVRAVAPGMECYPHFVQLAKPDELDVVLPLRIFPAGDLAGRVVDPDGDPVAGIEVRARRLDLDDAPQDAADAERVVQTDASGGYVFERLPDGEYSIAVGAELAPLVTREVGFAAPGFTMPDLVTPALAELIVRVTDGDNQAVSGAVVSVIGLPSGAREERTDAGGLARFPLCAGGAAKVVVDHPELGATTNDIQFQPGVVSEHSVRLVKR